MGERITTIADPAAVRAAVAILLLAPSPPLLFMGEEFGTEMPFLFFCDFEKGLAEAVAAGRRNEFARFARFNDPAARAGIPDPNAVSTFEASRLGWEDIVESPHREWLRFYRELLKLRCRHIACRLANDCAIEADYALHGDRGLTARWQLPDNSKLTLLANLGADSLSELSPPASSTTQIIYASEEVNLDAVKRGALPAWSVAWFLES